MGPVPAELFIRPDGLPMQFFMAASGAERQKVKRVVEAGGGVLLTNAGSEEGDYVIQLLVGRIGTGFWSVAASQHTNF